MKGFRIEIKNELLEPKHVKFMGASVWLFMFLIDHVTSIDERGNGLVLGGAPIQYDRHIKKELGISSDKYSRWIKKLSDYPYIDAERKPNGISFKVLKTYKRFRKIAGGIPQNRGRDSALMRNALYNNTVDYKHLKKNASLKGQRNSQGTKSMKQLLEENKPQFLK